MNRSTLAAWMLAAGGHAALLFGWRMPPSTPPVPKVSEDVIEVGFYQPPPPQPDPPPPLPPQPPPEPPQPEPEPEPPPQPPMPAPVQPPPEPEPAPAPVPTPEPAPPVAPTPTPERPRETPLPRKETQKPAPRAPTPPPPPAPRSAGYTDVPSVSYLRRGQAAYPPEARRAKQAGTVVLMLYINENGSVDRAEVVKSSGFPLLDQAAAKAEQKSRFRPAVVGGVPVKSKARVPYTFRLE